MLLYKVNCLIKVLKFRAIYFSFACYYLFILFICLLIFLIFLFFFSHLYPQCSPDRFLCGIIALSLRWFLFNYFLLLTTVKFFFDHPLSGVLVGEGPELAGILPMIACVCVRVGERQRQTGTILSELQCLC